MTATAKQDLLEGLLAHGMVLVHLDTEVEGVDVPDQFRGDRDLRLNLSYRFAGGLQVNQSGVTADLSFSSQPYTCQVPFESVFAMVSHGTGEAFFFPSDAPQQALEALARMVAEVDGEPDGAAQPRLRAIEGGESASCAGPAEVESTARRSHLRVVK